MAKVSFTKLGLNKEQDLEPTIIQHNGQDIEVKRYLPVSDKLDLISEVINKSYDGTNNFANPVKVTIFLSIGIVEKYTNINLTDKQKADPAKLYDLLVNSDLITEIKYAIPSEELGFLMNSTWSCIDAFYKYRDSVLGILDTVSQDYSDLDFDATAIQKKLNDPESMGFLKEVLEKMG